MLPENGAFSCLACPALSEEGYHESVHVRGEVVILPARCAGDIQNLELPEQQLYIVGTRKEDKEAVIASLIQRVPHFAVQMEYSMLPMFATRLSPAQLYEVLKDERVRYVEADGKTLTNR